MTDGTTVQRAAPAKLNLALAVGKARKSDGMHPIASWMVPISLHDDVRVTRLKNASESRCRVKWSEDALRPTEIDWPIEKDLAVRAHRALEHEVGHALPLQIEIEKQIPVGCGFGGGSSDAAAAMVSVCELFDLPISHARLLEIAISLGSDVPFFLPEDGEDVVRPAIVTGFGDVIERVKSVRIADGNEVWFVVVVPECSCATGAVYQRFDAIGSSAFRENEVSAMARAGVIESAALFNDLASAAMDVGEGLRAVVERVSEEPGERAMVTGSGSGVFVVCGTRERASELGDQIIETAHGVRLQIACLACRGSV